MVTFIMVLLLSGCADAGDGAARTMENYMTAVVAKDVDRAVALSCADWETDARMTVDSFLAVQIRLEDLSCEKTGEHIDTTLVTCQGKIVATYNNEDQEIDLSDRVYELIQEGGEYLVCGYR